MIKYEFVRRKKSKLYFFYGKVFLQIDCFNIIFNRILIVIKKMKCFLKLFNSFKSKYLIFYFAIFQYDNFSSNKKKVFALW